MKIHKFVLPTPFYVGPVNVYLIDESPITLIDAGPNTDEAWQVLNNCLKEIGREISQIQRIIISHAHLDHMGLAGQIQKASGACIYIHKWEVSQTLNLDDYICQSELFIRAGVPDEVIKQLKEVYTKMQELKPISLDNVDTLQDEDEILFDKTSLRVLHTPGHTPGSICILQEGTRHLFAADTLLKHITPNPTLHVHPNDSTDRFPALNKYIESVTKIKQLQPTHIQTGHGDDISDYGEHLHQLLHHTDLRQEKVLDFVSAKNSVTAWDLSQHLFPYAKNENLYLAISEAQAHLDLSVIVGNLTVEKPMKIEFFKSKK